MSLDSPAPRFDGRRRRIRYCDATLSLTGTLRPLTTVLLAGRGWAVSRHRDRVVLDHDGQRLFWSAIKAASIGAALQAVASEIVPEEGKDL